MTLEFDLSFDPAYGEPVTVRPGVARLTANNPGPFTFHGTNSYLVGVDTLAVIDPGPDDDDHLAALMAAIADGRSATFSSAIRIAIIRRSPRARAGDRRAGLAEGPHRAGPAAENRRDQPPRRQRRHRLFARSARSPMARRFQATAGRFARC